MLSRLRQIPQTASRFLAMMTDGVPSERRRAWLEPASVLLMGASTLATAWSSFQSERWNSRASSLGEKADELVRECLARNLDSQQIKAVHFHLFSELLNAKMAGNDKLLDFYFRRLPEDFRPAFEKWLATRPFENPAAPAHPFVPELYSPRHQGVIRQSRETAVRIEVEKSAASSHGGVYLGQTVILSAVLLFAGTARTFDQRRVRSACLGFAVVLFVYSFTRLVLLPIA